MFGMCSRLNLVPCALQLKRNGNCNGNGNGHGNGNGNGPISLYLVAIIFWLHHFGYMFFDDMFGMCSRLNLVPCSLHLKMNEDWIGAGTGTGAGTGAGPSPHVFSSDRSTISLYLVGGGKKKKYNNNDRGI